MAAGDPLAAVEALLNAQELLQTRRWIPVRFIDMKIHRAIEPFRQRQQSRKLPPNRRTAAGRCQDSTEQSTPVGHLSRQALARGGLPVGERNQSHQLKVDGSLPAIPQLPERSPARLCTGAKAVDMAAQGSKPMQAGSL